MGRIWSQDEPWFTDEDTSMLLDWFDYQDSLCSGCGQPKGLSFDPEHEWHFKAHLYACHSCASKARAFRSLDVVDGVYAFSEYTGPALMV